jgi:hypothetical protein
VKVTFLRYATTSRPGKKPISAEVRLAIVTRTAQEKPRHATHWSARMLAEELGVGHTTVQQVWKEHGLKPHLSRPPKFAEKVVDIVGLYPDPPDKPLCSASADPGHRIPAISITPQPLRGYLTEDDFG